MISWKFFLFLFLLTSCSLRGEWQEARILEQSRQHRPEWLEHPMQTFVAEGNHELFRTRKSKVLDLPLGLKQAEESAVQDLKMAITQRLARIWSQNPAFSDLDSVDRLILFDNAEKILSQHFKKDAIVDLYFEKRLDPSAKPALAESYDIHILLRADATKMREFLRELQSFCAHNPRQSLYKISQIDAIFAEP